MKVRNHVRSERSAKLEQLPAVIGPQQSDIHASIGFVCKVQHFWSRLNCKCQWRSCLKKPRSNGFAMLQGCLDRFPEADPIHQQHSYEGLQQVWPYPSRARTPSDDGLYQLAAQASRRPEAAAGMLATGPQIDDGVKICLQQRVEVAPMQFCRQHSGAWRFTSTSLARKHAVMLVQLMQALSIANDLCADWQLPSSRASGTRCSKWSCQRATSRYGTRRSPGTRRSKLKRCQFHEGRLSGASCTEQHSAHNAFHRLPGVSRNLNARAPAVMRST